MPETLETIVARIDALANSVDHRFTKTDERFTSIDERFTRMQADIDVAFAEQRKYTEYAFGQLETQIKDLKTEMTGGFGRLERRLDQLVAAPRRRSRRRRS